MVASKAKNLHLSSPLNGPSSLPGMIKRIKPSIPSVTPYMAKRLVVPEWMVVFHRQ
jgi:hypothetical protein